MFISVSLIVVGKSLKLNKCPAVGAKSWCWLCGLLTPISLELVEAAVEAATPAVASAIAAVTVADGDDDCGGVVGVAGLT